MSVQRLPSGRFRAQVYDRRTGRNVSVSGVIGGPGVYGTRDEAELARGEARRVLAQHPGSAVIRRPRPRKGAWKLATKGEKACRNCGAAPKHLHHILPKVGFPEVRKDWRRNGIPLCHACHRGWHNRIVDIPHELLGDAEFAFACEHAGAGWVGRHYPPLSESADARLRRLQAAERTAA